MIWYLIPAAEVYSVPLSTGQTEVEAVAAGAVPEEVGAGKDPSKKDW